MLQGIVTTHINPTQLAREQAQADAREWHRLQSVVRARWSLSAPCDLTGEREWVSSRCDRIRAREALAKLRREWGAMPW